MRMRKAESSTTLNSFQQARRHLAETKSIENTRVHEMAPNRLEGRGATPWLLRFNNLAGHLVEPCGICSYNFDDNCSVALLTRVQAVETMLPKVQDCKTAHLLLRQWYGVLSKRSDRGVAAFCGAATGASFLPVNRLDCGTRMYAPQLQA